MASRISFQTFFLVLTINIFAGLSAFAQSSYELMCRNKAKEIAAETYKNCVTEQRQSQIEQIRKDYKEKMADLKNHYDRELKKISSGKQSSATQITQTTEIVIPKGAATKANGKMMRASGARSLPKKTVRTQSIDLTTDSTENAQVSTPAPDESTNQSQNRINSVQTESENPQDVEIVELPTQE